jgi:DNA primase
MTNPKAQLIEYYRKIAPTILAHVKGRPLSLVRYRTGSASFFFKEPPGLGAGLARTRDAGRGEKDCHRDRGSVAHWLANLACIQLHQMHCRAPRDKPDYIVYDFDPPESFKFPQVAELAVSSSTLSLVTILCENDGTQRTARVGAIEPKWGFQEAFEAARPSAVCDSHLPR